MKPPQTRKWLITVFSNRPRVIICILVLFVTFAGNVSRGAEVFSASLPAWVGCVSFSPDGKQLAAASADSSARIFDFKTGRQIHALRGHKDYVVSLAFAPNGSALATASYDLTARIWDMKSSSAAHVLRGHRGALMSVAFSPDGKWL